MKANLDARLLPGLQEDPESSYQSLVHFFLPVSVQGFTCVVLFTPHCIKQHNWTR